MARRILATVRSPLQRIAPKSSSNEVNHEDLEKNDYDGAVRTNNIDNAISDFFFYLIPSKILQIRVHKIT